MFLDYSRAGLNTNTHLCLSNITMTTDWKPTADDLESLAAAKIAFKQGNTNDDVITFYSQWAKEGKYQKDTEPERYRAHIQACENIENYFPGSKNEVKVIDIGAGTGRVAVELLKKGFKLMDALEPTAEMLDEAKKQNHYKNYMQLGIGADKLPIDDNAYDLAIVSGAMGEGHIPCEALHEMARIVRPGGIISISMREEFLDSCTDYRGRLEPLMEKMEKDGEWKLVSREVRPNYYCGKSGLVYRFSPC
ncbi:methyltransferase-like protein 27 isoform X1 [Haliotis asinina]|uniref:methyltransferase-like protein 27 isoform X1 n=2 Tax=Haliotis asinina TaxID=109174 RepID=UPI003532449B